MKRNVILVLLFLTFNAVRAQDSSQVGMVQQSSATISWVGFNLSQTPTSTELAALFTSGKGTPSDEINAVVLRGDSAVAGLTDLLFDQSMNGPILSTSDTGAPSPCRMLVVLSLEKIGTHNAVATLTAAAMNHTDSEIRGAALEYLSTDYGTIVEQRGVVPSVQLLATLMKNIDDDTYVGSFQRTVGQIAYVGLMHWLGIDFGEPQYAQAWIDAEKSVGRQLTVAEFRQYWWEQNGAKLVWDKTTGHFVLPG